MLRSDIFSLGQYGWVVQYNGSFSFSLGKEVGSMFTGLLGEVPLLWKVPVLLLFVILLMFVMILFAGYEVRLPLFLGKIGPANNGSGTENTALQQQISELKSMIAVMKSGSMAVE